MNPQAAAEERQRLADLKPLHLAVPEEVLRVLAEAPRRKIVAAVRVLELEQERAACESSLKRRRYAIAAEVSAAVGAMVEGKAKPAFSNAEARTAETERRLDADKDAEGYAKRLSILEDQVARARLDLTFEEDCHASAKAASRLYGGNA